MVSKGNILTRDVLKARGWEEDEHCLLCARQESIGHS